MAEEALNQETTPAEGAAPAEQPAAQDGVEKTPEQLEAEKKAADEAEAKKKQEEEEAEEQAIRKKPWFQRRIDEITKQRHEAERRAERLEQMMQQIIERTPTGQPPGQQQAPPQAPPDFQATRPAPTREQYEFDENRYLEAVVDWRIEQREAKAMHERRVAEQQQAQQGFVTYFEERRTKCLEEGRTKYPDYEQVVFSLPPQVMNHELAVAIFETGSPADIAYHLGKNPAEAERLSKLPPLKKAIELGRLETKITQATRPTSQAPPPPNPVGGRTPAGKSESAMTMDEWLKARNAGKITGMT